MWCHIINTTYRKSNHIVSFLNKKFRQDQWCNTQGAECPPDTSHWEISADLPGKEREGKKGKWRRKEGKLKKRKVENWKWKEEKLQNEERPFFFFFFFFLLFTLQNHLDLFWVYQKWEGIFYPENAFHAGRKIKGKWLYPSEKYCSFAPPCPWVRQKKKKAS